MAPLFPAQNIFETAPKAALWLAVSLLVAVLSLPVYGQEKSTDPSSEMAGFEDRASAAEDSDSSDDMEARITRPAASIEEALAKIPLGGFNQAVKDLLRFGYEGDAQAFFHLAELHRLGVTRDTNTDLAVMYYRLAAKGGHGRASLSLANLLFFDIGDGIARDEALDIWTEEAITGKPEALYMLGLMYWNGEAIGFADPVRGYGLVWRSAELGYAAAIDAELEMRVQIAFDARQAGTLFAESLSVDSFDDAPLNLDLVLAGIAPAVSERTAPDDWTTVWRVEVGFALPEKDLPILAGTIAAAYPDKAAVFARTEIPSKSTAGTFRLLYGPMNDADEAVGFCVSLKRIGQDCFARAPE